MSNNFKSQTGYSKDLPEKPGTGSKADCVMSCLKFYCWKSFLFFDVRFL